MSTLSEGNELESIRVEAPTTALTLRPVVCAATFIIDLGLTNLSGTAVTWRPIVSAATFIIDLGLRDMPGGSFGNLFLAFVISSAVMGDSISLLA